MRTRRVLGGAATAAAVIVMMLGGSGPAGAVGAQVPFAASFQGHIGFTDETMTAVAWSGSGVATRLGRAAGAGNIVLTGRDDVTCPGGIANVHTATLTAADGDAVTLTSQDVSCPLGGGQFHGSGHWTVTGGTGRFASVTGSGSILGDANFATGAFNVSWTGSFVL